MDKAHKATDKRIAAMESHLRAIYTRADKEVREAWDKYMRTAQEALKPLQKAYEDAKKSGDKDETRKTGLTLAAKKREMTITNAHYKAVVERTAQELTHINEIATAYVNGELPDVYALNYNFVATGMQEVSGISFDLYDAHTVRNLAMSDETLLPYKVVDVAKDVRWNTKLINSEVLQGILQGESMSDIAARLTHVEDMAANAAIRNARTMVTSAENKGRIDMMNDAEKQGVIALKRWISTHDARTRDWHAELDGQMREKDKPFENSVGKIMYPGDPSANPANVYNCFVGETNIASDCGIIRSYKSEYHGELVTVKTSCGVCFACTSNHPILTGSGWIGAKSLNKGDDIIIARCRDNVFGRINPNVNHGFPRIDALHEFFDMSGGKRTVSMSVNFHGDIPTTNVEIITQKRFLRDDINSRRYERLNKFSFKASYKSLAGKSALVKHLLGIVRTAFGFVRCFGELLAFGLRRLRHSEIHSLRPIAWLDSNGIKPLNDDASGNSELLRESLNGFSGLVFADNIVSVDFCSGNAHVYNLQTQNGYYFVNTIISQSKRKSNGFFAVAHNCRCAIGYKVTGFGQKQQTKAEAGTKEQAVDKLKQIGFNDVESSFVKYVDKDLAVSVTKQLEKLEQRFKAIANSHGNICSVSGGKKTVAYVSSSLREPTRQNLSLCPAYYRDKSVLLESEKRAQKINWMMPCSENEYEIYTVTHEYGHMLENTIIYSEMKQYGLEKLADEINIDAKTAKKMYKPYYDIHNKVTKDCFSEITDIAKKENPEFSLSENISQYGKTNYAEFFAEVFANSQLSKPNELGKAMQKWLKQKGY